MNIREPNPRDDYDDRSGNARARENQVPWAHSRLVRNPWLMGMALGFALAFVALMISPFISGDIHAGAMRVRSSNNLKAIGIAIRDYHDVYGEMPRNTVAADGTPLLSWRVHLLPFLEQESLHTLFQLDEPWNGPVNRHLLDRMPPVFASPRDPANRRGYRTFYRGFCSSGTVFEPRSPTIPWRRLPILGPLTDHRMRSKPDPWPYRFTLSSIADGPGNTILVVEAGEPVEWTKPEDLDASPGRPFPRMGGLRWRNGFQAVMGDAAVRQIDSDTPEAELRALISYAGGETVLDPD